MTAEEIDTGVVFSRAARKSLGCLGFSFTFGPARRWSAACALHAQAGATAARM
ncbi:hypothetical protein G4177_09705 [Corallococcus sp. ZKHCc1 1396]|uniref:Uncharacterized protein n=1 Tax=Corallococcus soli TaxID=2710757 RepID=A0ABR9PKI6_9BACT|nr:MULTISPECIES: hypothetical protein [Corallococcus]MBE4748438.1 hypothetical protein [Corallococcus soli]MCY1034775.1 hypothetical protein [Corallococcus sp. BB11-1]